MDVLEDVRGVVQLGVPWQTGIAEEEVKLPNKAANRSWLAVRFCNAVSFVYNRWCVNVGSAIRQPGYDSSFGITEGDGTNERRRNSVLFFRTDLRRSLLPGPGVGGGRRNESRTYWDL
jgi:hypothetical protein